MLNTEETQNTEEIEKEVYELYLAEERKIFDSLLSNDAEFNKTMRYFSGGLLVLMTAYIDWKSVNHVIYTFISYAPFILSIISNIVAYILVRESLKKQSEFNEDYYLRNIAEARYYESAWGRAGSIFSYISIGSFIVGILLFTIFIGIGILTLKGG